MNIQYSVKIGIPYFLEANPRASRTVPFVSKAISYPLAKLASKVMIGKSVKDLIPKEYLAFLLLIMQF